jgi:uncharacterized protein YlzI (FlbEa/FlbD family)
MIKLTIDIDSEFFVRASRIDAVYFDYVSKQTIVTLSCGKLFGVNESVRDVYEMIKQADDTL